MLWGLMRHEWGSVHFWVSAALLVVLAAHVALHWQWLVTVIGKRVLRSQEDRPPLTVKGLVFAALLLCGAGAFLAAATVSRSSLEFPEQENIMGNVGRKAFDKAKSRRKADAKQAKETLRKPARVRKGKRTG